MLRLDLLEVETQGLEQEIRKHGDAVILPFAIADDDLVTGKIQVLDTQAHDFHETQSAAVHDLSHDLVDAVHLCNDLLRLLAGEDGRDALGFRRADGDESAVVQLDLKHIAVEKKGWR